ncbi:DUF3857 domain-containing protein [Leeuwenhoekiella sp. A16]|uniref:DUF3857 domain-containing protein n=1 Tax=unclassified Leeuwenhoekiella TaxID=2615029 RepID=UPI003A812E06
MKLILLIAVILFYNWGQAQNYNYGKVSKEELRLATYPDDSTASAVILHRGRETYFEYDSSDGWIIVSEVQERIKILNKEGLDYATQKISFYNDGSAEEEVRKIEALTFNLEDERIVKTDLDEEGIFEEENNEHWTTISLALPNVKVGSVIEYKYKLISPFFKIDDLIFQEKIPVDNVTFKVRIPPFFTFNRLRKGYFEIEPKDHLKKRSMSVSWAQEGAYGGSTMRTNSGVMNFSELISDFEMQHIPALHEEPYVNNIENYQFKIVYELQSVKNASGKEKKYASTWEDVAKSIFESENFGEQLVKPRFLKNDYDRINNQSVKLTERLQIAFDFIKEHMTWNGDKRKYVEEDLSKAYDKGSGNSAEINLMLTALLREVGLDANPVLISTRDNGFPMFPTREGYNYVIASVRLNGELILLDATEKFSVPNLLPARVYNWKGRLINKNGASEEVELYSDVPAHKNTLISAEIDQNGAIIGKSSTRFMALDALNYRRENANKEPETLATQKADENNLAEVYDLSIENIDELDSPVIETYNFEIGHGADIIGDKLYFTPLLYTALNASPFTLEERQYPVDFVHPFSLSKIVNLKYPDNYKVESIPEPLNVALPNGLGTFLYNITNQNGYVNVIARFVINKVLIEPADYASLKEFYNQRVKKEQEKIVLTKV